MSLKYTIIDNTGSPIRMTVDDIDGYVIETVNPFRCNQYSTIDIAQAELNNINRILKNSDYYEVYVSKTVDLPLKLSGVESSIKFIEL